MYVQDLTTRELMLLHDILSMHLEGMIDAKKHMLDDRSTLGTFDKFVDAMQQLEIDEAAISNIKRKVDNVFEDRTCSTSSIRALYKRLQQNVRRICSSRKSNHL
jgi:hypothetical protein